MNIPLEPQEIEAIMRASVLSNKVYSDSFKALAYLKGDRESIGDPRLTLAALQEKKELLMSIRRDLSEEPALTDGHVQGILGPKNTVGPILQNLQREYRTSGADAVERKIVDDESIVGISHSPLGRIGMLHRAINQVCQMVEGKIK